MKKLFFKKLLKFYFVPSTFLLKKFIFIHIPKTGGIAVCRALGVKPHGHIKYFEYENILKINRYFTFTVIRDPVFRFISAYNYLAAGGRNKFDLKSKKEFNITKDNFNNFIDGLGNMQKIPIHFQTQSSFLLNKQNNLNINFICKFEQLDKDFKELTKILNLEDVQLQKENISKKIISIDELNKKQIQKIENYYYEDRVLYEK